MRRGYCACASVCATRARELRKDDDSGEPIVPVAAERRMMET